MFSEKFAFQLPALINFVGGGGKSSLILRLQEEFAEVIPAVYTTTTRIHPPHPTDGLAVIACDCEDYLKALLESASRAASCSRRLVVTSLTGKPDLRHGVSSAFGAALDRTRFPLILNEADGARSMSLKMPRANEPVLMNSANALVPVIGLDCLDQPLGPESVFRWEVVSQYFGNRAGEPIGPELAASILLHPHGVCRDWRPGMRIIPFLNKADTESGADAARILARALLCNGDFPVHRVVWGSLRNGTADCMDRDTIQ